MYYYIIIIYNIFVSLMKYFETYLYESHIKWASCIVTC